MRERELYAALTALPPLYVRLDGRAFHRLARALDLARPFDERFAGAMAAVARRLVADSGASPVFAYTFSDEISCFFTELPFGGRVEKLDSVLAAFAASALTIELGLAEPVAFDARVVFVDPASAYAYLAGRQAEAWRNHINAYAQSLLVGDGLSPREAAARLRGLASPALHDLAYRARGQPGRDAGLAAAGHAGLPAAGRGLGDRSPDRRGRGRGPVAGHHRPRPAALQFGGGAGPPRPSHPGAVKKIRRWSPG